MTTASFGRKIGAIVMLCVSCCASTTTAARDVAFVARTTKTQTGILITQYINSTAFPASDGTPLKANELSLPGGPVTGPRLIRLLLPLSEKRHPGFIMGIQPEQEVLLGGLANGDLSLVYYRDRSLSVSENPFRRSGEAAPATKRDEIPAWGRSFKLTRPASKDATHLVVTAYIWHDPAATASGANQGNISINVCEALVEGNDVAVGEEIVMPIHLTVSEESWQRWRNLPISAGSGTTLDNAVNAPHFDIAAIDQRSIPMNTANTGSGRDRRDTELAAPANPDASAAVEMVNTESFDAASAASAVAGEQRLINFLPSPRLPSARFVISRNAAPAND